MESLTSLKALFLDAFNKDGVGISGPLLSFSNMPKIRTLRIGSNALTGTIPSSLLAGIDSYDETVDVDLSSNHLTGSVPSEFAVFNDLNLLVADNFIESIDDSLCSKSSWLQGSLGSFSCDALLCPAGTFNSYGRQTSSDTPCTPCPGDVPPYMGQTSCLTDDKEKERQILEAFFNSVGGERWKKRDGWLEAQDYCTWYGIECVDSRVESISLGSNNLQGTPPKKLFELSNLKSLWLYSNPIDFKFDGIANASRLQNLRLDSTGLQSLDGIENAHHSLVEIDVRFNRLQGTLPDLNNLVELRSFSCSANNLSGPLPSFSNNKKLASFRAGGNSFSGPMPSFDSHPWMKTIDISENHLKGAIPSDLLAQADHTASIFLDLSSNMLTGAVPETLGRFSDLTIYIRENQIDQVPSRLCSMSEWNQGDVGLEGCDGILCPPNTFAPTTGRASRRGSKCQRCDDANYFGATTCAHSGTTAMMSRSLGGLVASVFLSGLFLR